MTVRITTLAIACGGTLATRSADDPKTDRHSGQKAEHLAGLIHTVPCSIPPLRRQRTRPCGWPARRAGRPHRRALIRSEPSAGVGRIHHLRPAHSPLRKHLAMSICIRIGTFNHKNGGGAPGNWTRLDGQLDDLALQRYDVLISTEGKHWLDHGAEGLRRAQDALGLQPYLARAQRHDCHLVIWVRPDRIHVRDTAHQERHPYWHALAVVIADIESFEEPVTIIGAHLSPFDPAYRITEAMALNEFTGRYALMAGDFQDPGVDEDHTIWDEAPMRKRMRHARHLGQTSATVLHDQGWRDIAAAVQNDPAERERTAGFPAYPVRCDKLYASEDMAGRCEIKSYRVGPRSPELSDHRRVDAELVLS